MVNIMQLGENFYGSYSIVYNHLFISNYTKTSVIVHYFVN